MEREGVVDFSNTYRKQELLKLNTVEYAKLLQAQFRREIELFNEARRSASSSIQLYRVSKTEADFMLFRNGVKLVISATQAGRIHFAFNQYMGQVHAPAHSPQIEIEAQWGTLDQLVWIYRGEILDPKAAMARGTTSDPMNEVKIERGTMRERRPRRDDRR